MEEYLKERQDCTEGWISDAMLRDVLKTFETTIKEELEEEVKKTAPNTRQNKWSMKGTSVSYRNIDHNWMFEVKNARFIKEPDQVSSSKCRVHVFTANEGDRKRKP